MAHIIGMVHEENGVFGISFPDFPGCISTADTFDGCLVRGAQALAFHVEGMIEDGEAMPLLRTTGQIAQDATLTDVLSGATLVALPLDLPGKAVRVNITLDEHLLKAIDRAASARGATRSGFLADAARARMAGNL